MKIWTEKHRPRTFEKVKGQDKIVERIKNMTSNKNIPNLLFAGPPGVGKSTLAMIIANKFFGEDINQNFLELNASDERGIDVVRGKIKDFSRTKSMGNVPFKIIFLDECDSLTKEAQQALRRTMENFTDNVRFILSCNYSSKIMEPIQSRCTVFRFRRLESDSVKNLVEELMEEEDIKITDKAIEALNDVGEGDIRKVVNILQSCAVMNKNIDEKLIYDIVSVAEPKQINDVLILAVNGDFIKSRDKLLDTMLKYGFSGLDSIKQIQKEILKLDIKEEIKAKMIEKCGETEFRIVEGSDEFLQLESLLAAFSLIK